MPLHHHRQQQHNYGTAAGNEDLLKPFDPSVNAPRLTFNALIPYGTDINVSVNLVIHIRQSSHLSQSL
jgi:hypothetical protein